MLPYFIAAFVIVWILVNPVAGLWILMIADFSMPTFFSAWAYINIGIRVYFLDVVLIPLFLLAVMSGKLKFSDKWLKHPMMLWIIYGIFSVFYSLFFSEHRINDTLGYFRRYFFYPALSYYTIRYYAQFTGLVRYERMLPRIIWISSLSLILLALTRYTLGFSFYHQFSFGGYSFEDNFRALSHVEALCLELGVFYFAAQLIYKKVGVFSITGLMLFASATFVFLSGFRIMILSLLVSAPIFIICYHISIGNWSIREMLKIVLKFAIILSLITVLIPLIAPNLYQKQIGTMIEKIALTSSGNLHIQGIGWRLALWGHNFTEFLKSPLIGQGIGYQSFWYHPGTGEALKNDPHNVILSLGVRLGIIGLILFSWLHLVYIRVTLKILRGSSHSDLIIPLFLFYLMFLFVGLLQPGPFGPHGASLMWISMALVISIGDQLKINEFDSKRHRLAE